MSPQGALKTSKALEGVHGVHLVPHSPFPLEEINQHRDFQNSTCESSVFGASQQLIVQWVKKKHSSVIICLYIFIYGHSLRWIMFKLFSLSYLYFNGTLNKFLVTCFLRRVWQQRPSCLRPIKCSLHGIINISPSIQYALC